MGQKQDLVPGIDTSIVITPTRTGRFPLVCTELCGLGHALMRSHADVVTEAKFADFMKNGANAGPPGLAVFQQNGCGSCHTFKPASATGKVGPDLDDLKASAAKANRGPLNAFIEESIVDPAAYIAPGFPDAMPHIFKQQIPSEELQQLVQYLSQGAK
jgi:cytochrome c oxidase subunit 2